jgi:hypothetical protein
MRAGHRVAEARLGRFAPVLCMALVACAGAPAPTVSGTVRAPGAALVPTGADPATAPVPAGIEVRLEQLDPAGKASRVIFTTLTAAGGRYGIELFGAERPASTLLVGVGAGDQVMRAFALGPQSDISPASEAAVRLVLASGVPLPKWTVDQLRALTDAVAAAVATPSAGDSVEAANRAAEEAARRSPAVAAALRRAA